jgi:hypothetical protein
LRSRRWQKSFEKLILNGVKMKNNEVWIQRWLRNGPDGREIRFGVRGSSSASYQEFYDWLGNKGSDHNEDFPWHYFTLSKEDDKELRKRWEVVKESSNNKPYVPPVTYKPTSLDKMIAAELHKAIQEEINKEVIAQILVK